MLGKLFKHLESFGINELGAEKWDSLLESRKLKASDYSVETEQYMDKNFRDLIESLANDMGLSIPDIWRKFGTYSVATLLKSHSDLIAPYPTAQELLSKLNDMHYFEVKKLYPNAALPYFNKLEATGNTLISKYRSYRKLCHYLEGGIEAVSKHYDKKIHYTQTTCMHRGDQECIFEFKFSR